MYSTSVVNAYVMSARLNAIMIRAASLSNRSHALRIKVEPRAVLTADTPSVPLSSGLNACLATRLEISDNLRATVVHT